MQIKHFLNWKYKNIRQKLLLSFKLYNLLILFAFILSISCNNQKGEKNDGVFITEGTASWYGEKFNGRRTASGEIFDMNKLTAAHKKLEFGTLVKVENLENGKEVVVKINDRGPFSKNRVIDLSKKAAAEIEMLNSGLEKVSISIYGYEQNNFSVFIKHFRNLQIIRYGKISF